MAWRSSCHPDRMTGTLLASLPARGPGRRTDRQAERDTLFSRPTRSLQAHFLTLSFAPTPFLAPSPRTTPSIPHTATNTKARAEKQEDVPRASSEKMS